MPDLVHRIGTRVEARPDELWILGQTTRYVRDRDIVWARLAPPFLAGHIPTLEGQKALWDLSLDIAAGTIHSPEDIRARGIINPRPLTPNDREAIFDLWRELAAGTVRAIQDHREVHPSRWNWEARLTLNFQEKQGETTGDFEPFLVEVERLMGDMLFPAVELISAFPRRTPFQLAGLTPIAPTGAIAPLESEEPAPSARKPTRFSRAVEALPQLFPGGWEGKSHREMLKQLKTKGGIPEISDRTLKRVLRKLAERGINRFDQV